MNLLVPLLLLLRRADGERVARNAVGFDQVSDGTTIRPQIWVSTATAGENIRWRVIVSPHPLRPPRCVDVLWGCARKTTHLRSLTPSDGQNSDLQSKCLSWGLYFYICAALHKWAWPWPMMSNKKMCDWRGNRPITTLSVCAVPEVHSCRGFTLFQSSWRMNEVSHRLLWSA